MASLTIRGSVSLEGSEYPIAGVSVIATICQEDEEERRASSYEAVRLQLGRVETDSDGGFI